MEYISARSKNLHRLHDEAKRRADGTATAVEELLHSLEYSFASVRQRLNEARQAIPTDTFSVEAIVTPQAINEGREATLKQLEGAIRGALKRQLIDARNATWRRVRRHCNARTRRWFPATDNLDADAVLNPQFELDSEETGLAGASKSCGRVLIRMVNQQIMSSLSSSMQHLRSRTEAREIGSSTHDIESSLDKFQRIHDDGVRSFYAYISAPNSIDLLREHGFVGFDETGGQAVQTKSIHALNCIGFSAISKASESCKERLRVLHREDDDELDRPRELDEGWSIEDTILGDGYCEHVKNGLSRVCQRRVDDFVSSLSDRIARFVEDVSDERSDLASATGRIWKARGVLIGRFALVMGSLVLALFAFAKFAPSKAEFLLSLLPDHLLETALVGALSTVLVLGLVYVISGAKNENTRSALNSVLLERWKSGARRRKLWTVFRAYFDESYDQLVEDLAEMPLQINHAIANGIVERLKKESISLRDAERVLAELREVIATRSALFDEFIRIVTQHLTEIPKELRDAAGEIKKDTIEAHMCRIRDAFGSVERVRSDIKQTMDIVTFPR